MMYSCFIYLRFKLRIFCIAGSDPPDVLRTVRQAVLSLKPQGRSHVQALCDMLLRCAATHYFEQQVLPARSKPEVKDIIKLQVKVSESQCYLKLDFFLYKTNFE